MALESGRLQEAQVPAHVARIVTGPDPGKLMAAKGVSPLGPHDLVIAIYQLSFDPGDAVKAAAIAAPALLPDKVLTTALGDALPAEVIHFFAERIQTSRVEVLERILFNRATADETFVTLARKLDERELEIIFANEERLLRHPAIVETLYFNKRARMSSVNRAIELCVRHGIRLDAIPSYDEIARSISGDAAAFTEEADQAFGQVLQAAEKLADVAPEEPAPLDLDGHAPPAAAPAAPEEEAKKRAVIDFTKLKLHEKIRLATLGNAYCRSVLIRDSNKVVALASIRSPQVTDLEVVRAAGNRALSEDVIRYIASQRDWVKMYGVKINLVTNPKCPIALSLRMLSFLHPEDLKKLSRSKNVPSALSTTARKIVQARGIE